MEEHGQRVQAEYKNDSGILLGIREYQLRESAESLEAVIKISEDKQVM